MKDLFITLCIFAVWFAVLSANVPLLILAIIPPTFEGIKGMYGDLQDK